MKKLRTITLSLVLAACTREGPKTVAEAMRPTALPAAVADDLAFAGLAEGAAAQATYHRTAQRPVTLGPDTVPAETYAVMLDGLAAALAAGKGAEYLATCCKAYEVYGNDDWGEVKLTSYYEPLIKGSRTPTPEHSEALLRAPDDLLVIATGAFWEPIKDIGTMRGRMDPAKPNRVIPYHDRTAIYGGALAGRGLELAYVDPIDGFFMQVQGSGTVALDDGTELRVGYADQNGHPYSAIGKYLLDVIPKEKMSMDAIVNHLRTLDPVQRTALLAKNPSYVFFLERSGAPVTSNNTPVVAGRTIATDAKFFPKGTLAILSFEHPPVPPEAKPRRVTRLVFDQDTGGAIKGGGRVDLFWGRGAEAGRIAGAVNQKARLVYLAPR